MSDVQGKLPEIIVFAGPNGSGKTTISRMAKVIEPYINADDIKMTTHCSDLDAAVQAEHLREIQILRGLGFTFETVLSTERNMNLLQRAKESGFFIRCIYAISRRIMNFNKKECIEKQINQMRSFSSCNNLLIPIVFAIFVFFKNR